MAKPHQEGFSERALYVLDKECVIRYSYISPRLGHMPDIYELYRALSEITGIPAPRRARRPPWQEVSAHDRCEPVCG